ncbi:MAG: protein phosphatase 2C domain-containing protein [Prevotellaceae bacterium]|jgi:protein phosphatase|nr:protein phosphatase 2C domain-containing protein [Prevotellaceae bacterium]
MKIILKQPYSFLQLGKRENQEDARFPNEDLPSPGQCYFMVCDGVGGNAAGEIASATVCEAIARYMEDEDLTRPFTADDFKNCLSYAYQQLYKEMRKRNCFDMATTLTFLCFHAHGGTIAHMGDSRVYHIRPERGILYKTNDHSLVNALVRSGNITPQEAIEHPQSNYITRCIAYVADDKSFPAADLYEFEDIAAGDYFFLCSDGVLHRLPDETLVTILSEPIEDRLKMEKIAALSKDSQDNNTAILIPIEESNNQCFEERPPIDIDPEAELSTQIIHENRSQIKEITPTLSQPLGTRIMDLIKNIF